MRNPEEIFNEVRRITSEQMGEPIEKITMSTHFRNDLASDSLDEVELVMSYENEFAVEIQDDNAIHFYTIHDVVAFLYQKIHNIPLIHPIIINTMKTIANLQEAAELAIPELPSKFSAYDVTALIREKVNSGDWEISSLTVAPVQTPAGTQFKPYVEHNEIRYIMQNMARIKGYATQHSGQFTIYENPNNQSVSNPINAGPVWAANTPATPSNASSDLAADLLAHFTTKFSTPIQSTEKKIRIKYDGKEFFTPSGRGEWKRKSDATKAFTSAFMPRYELTQQAEDISGATITSKQQSKIRREILKRMKDSGALEIVEI